MLCLPAWQEVGAERVQFHVLALAPAALTALASLCPHGIQVQACDGRCDWRWHWHVAFASMPPALCRSAVAVRTPYQVGSTCSNMRLRQHMCPSHHTYCAQ